MENSPWRIVFFATGASLILLFSILIIVLPRSSIEIGKDEKIASFKKTYVSGRENGEKKWEFSAESGYTDKETKNSHLQNVKNGILYNEDDTVAKNLTIPELSVNPSTKVIEGFAKDRKQIHAKISFSKKDGKREFADMLSNYLLYDPNKKISKLNGNINISGKNIKMRASDVIIDHNKEIAEFSNNIKIERGDITFSSKNLTYDSNTEKLEAKNGSKAIIKGKQKTIFNSSNMDIFVDDKKDVEAFGSIEAVQGKKSASADKAVYNKSQKTIILGGNVKAVFSKGSALLKQETLKKIKTDDAKKMLEEKTFLSADNLTLSTISGDAKAAGNVVVSQKGREAKSQAAEYFDDKEIIILTKDVYLKKDNEWIKAASVEVSVKNETFTAVGSVEAEFQIKK